MSIAARRNFPLLSFAKGELKDRKRKYFKMMLRLGVFFATNAHTEVKWIHG